MLNLLMNIQYNMIDDASCKTINNLCVINVLVAYITSVGMPLIYENVFHNKLFKHL